MGAESGPEARAMEYKWAQDIAGQCAQANVPLFYKQGTDDNGVNVKMPRLLGRVWDQMPTQVNKVKKK